MSQSIPNRRIFVQDVIDGDGAIDPDRLLYVVNLFMEAVYEMSEKGLSFNDHVNADIVKLDFKTENDYTTINTFNEILFTPTLKGKRADGIILARVQEVGNIEKVFYEPVTISWAESQDQLKITFITGLEDNKSYKLTILVI